MKTNTSALLSSQEADPVCIVATRWADQKQEKQKEFLWDKMEESDILFDSQIFISSIIYGCDMNSSLW